MFDAWSFQCELQVCKQDLDRRSQEWFFKWNCVVISQLELNTFSLKTRSVHSLKNSKCTPPSQFIYNYVPLESIAKLVFEAETWKCFRRADNKWCFLSNDAPTTDVVEASNSRIFWIQAPELAIYPVESKEKVGMLKSLKWS